VPVRPIEDLINVERPALPWLTSAVAAAGERATVLPVEGSAGEDVLFRLQVTVASALGALARYTGGVLVEHSWLRLLGGGGEGLPNLADANSLGSPTANTESPPFLEVGRDVLGGRFAVNGGGFEGPPGQVFYFAPDTLAWESLGVGHGDFVAWALSDAISDFYADLRWEGWETDTAAVPLDHGLSVYPPLFTAQTKTESVTRRSIPWRELSDYNQEMAAQLGGIPDGAQFRIRPQD
jgi:hypothetical protein